ncbi:UNVERIFIED_CONTAM: hypothetical protein Slati_0474400 [Sesamum latifolium]|uniref:Reverse transcriptase domain-containing protein n=1 Tax=Sesamum latifolium TaxID=2727402 RepID=A0AAW2XWG2_9LAMI
MADKLPMNCRTPENAALLHRYTDGIKCRVFVTTFARAAQQCRKLRKTERSLFAVRQKDNEPLKEYMQRFNVAALEVTFATQEVKASAFSQGLSDGDFFQSLAKKPVSKFDALLARVAKYINMEDAQAAKRESRGEKRKEVKEVTPSKKPRIDTRDKKPPFQRVNAVYTPLTIPITQAFMAVDEKGLLTRPRNTCTGRKLGARDLYQKREGDKAKEVRATSPERSPQEGTRQASGSKGDNNDIPRKGVIRMIIGGPSGGDSHRARKSQIREAYDTSIKEVIEVEAMEDTPLIQFGRAERSGSRTSHNDALVITAVLANYEVGHIFIDSGSSADILFGEAYDQMQLGDVSLEKPAEELLNIEVTPGNPDKTTRIGSHLGGRIKEEIISCLRRNADIFAWAPQDLEGIDPKVITHHLNIDPGIKPVKQKKRHFGPEKDKVIRAEVDKLMAAGHIEEIQFPEWLSNVVLVPKPGGKWRMCINFRDLNKACPKDFYPLPRIDQLVDSTSGCELLSMMDASQRYHQIMLAPEDRKKVSFITSSGTFCYVAMPFGLKMPVPLTRDLWTRYSDRR